MAKVTEVLPVPPATLIYSDGVFRATYHVHPTGCACELCQPKLYDRNGDEE